MSIWQCRDNEYCEYKTQTREEKMVRYKNPATKQCFCSLLSHAISFPNCLKPHSLLSSSFCSWAPWQSDSTSSSITIRVEVSLNYSSLPLIALLSYSLVPNWEEAVACPRILITWSFLFCQEERKNKASCLRN